MKIKKLIYCFSIISIICILSANAQTNLGFDLGINNNSLMSRPINSSLSLSAKFGYNTNLTIGQQLKEWVALEISPGIVQKNYSIKNKNKIYQDVNNTYLQIPLGIKFEKNFTIRLKLSCSIGGYYAYWLNSTINGIAPNVFEFSTTLDGDELIKLQNIKQRYSFNKYDSRSELGFMSKLGLKYNNSKHLSYSFKIHYYRSLTSQQNFPNELETSRYNKTLGTTIGIEYALN